MPTTANLALPYPDLASAPNVPADIQALALALDAITGLKRTHGSVVAGATNSSGVITVTHSLGVTPANIQATVVGANSTGDMTLRRSAKTSTTFSLIYFYDGANAGTNTVSFDWICEA